MGCDATPEGVSGDWGRARHLAALLILTLSACHSPSTPDTAGTLYYDPAVSEERMAWAEQEWQWQADCIGLDIALRAPRPVKVITHDGPFYCGTVWANGCANFPNSIDVNEKTWEGALSHEIIHWQMILLGWPPDNAHKGSMWAKCDHLNYAAK